MKLRKLNPLFMALAVLAIIVAFSARVFHLAATAGPVASIGAAVAAFALADWFITPVFFRTPSDRLYNNPTFIVPILTSYVAEAFRSFVPELKFFSQDFGKQGEGDGAIFADPVKFGQEVISKVALPPTSDLFFPGSGLGSNAQSVKGLVQDVAVRINRARKVTIVLRAADAAQYILDPAFKASVMESARTLGRDIVSDAILSATYGNFSQQTVQAKASADRTTLRNTRKAMNLLTRVPERFMLGNTDIISAIADDPEVRSSQFNNQRVQADPFISLINLEGFTEVREFPNMPNGNVAISTFTTNFGSFPTILQLPVGTLSTAVYLPVQNGDRVQVTNTGGGLPTGLAVSTNYWVVGMNVANDTISLATTPGGGAISLTGDSTGTSTVSHFENLNALAFEKRAIHIAVRPLLDAIDAAIKLGVPVNLLPVPHTDAETGMSMTGYLWTDTSGTNPTGDLYCTLIIGYGIIAGRGAAVDFNNPGPASTFAAGTGFDYAGYRLVETAN